ncbi:MAG TPA: hypothetical protein VGW74_09295 [Propionibacteriaceae bacterium]|nr:hypothetical protein [Propionibacteriaceae bacterium]
MTIRRLPVALAVVGVTLALSADRALAQVAPGGDASPDAPASAVFTVNNTLVTVLLGVVAPLVTGFLLRPTNPAWVKVLVAGMVGTAFTAVSQVVQDDGTAALSQEWFLQLALLLAAQFGAYYGIWNPVLRSQGGVNEATGPGVVPVGPKP